MTVDVRPVRGPSAALAALLVFLGLLGICFLTAAFLLWPRSARFELLSNLRFFCGLAACFGAAVLLWLRRWRWSTLGWALAAFHLAPELLLCVPHESPAAGSPTLRFVSANLLYGQADPLALAAYLAEVDPAVVVLCEITEPNRGGHDWTAILAQWSERYPYQVRYPDPRFSIALLARWPILRSEFHTVGEGQRISGQAWTEICPMIEVELDTGQGSLTVFASHFPRPHGRWSLGVRSDMIQRLRERRGCGARVVLGDLNTTASSRIFKDLLRQAELYDSRRGFGPCFSWRDPRSPVLLLAIDHVLHSRELVTRMRQVGPEIGSDHRPIFAELTWSK